MHVQRCISDTFGTMKETRPIAFEEKLSLSKEVCVRLSRAIPVCLTGYLIPGLPHFHARVPPRAGLPACGVLPSFGLCLLLQVFTKLPGTRAKFKSSPSTSSIQERVAGSGSTLSAPSTLAASTGEGPQDKPGSEDDFKLMSVIAHAGSSYGGHFYCYRRIPGAAVQNDEEGSPTPAAAAVDTWVRLSDREVFEVPISTVLGCEAYMLFYEKE